MKHTQQCEVNHCCLHRTPQVMVGRQPAATRVHNRPCPNNPGISPRKPKLVALTVVPQHWEGKQAPQGGNDHVAHQAGTRQGQEKCATGLLFCAPTGLKKVREEAKTREYQQNSCITQRK